MTTLAAAVLDRRLAVAVAHTGSPRVEVHIARALIEVGAVDSKNVEQALGAAARLNAAAVGPSTIRRNYPLGGLTHDFILGVVAKAA